MPISRSRTLPPAGALCDLLAAAAPAGPSGTIDELCAEMAGLLAAEVATVYALERGEPGALVVVGNVGFPPEVVGNLRLRVGDGIVGTVAAHLHPIAIVAGARDPRFKSVRGIGEEQFPVLLAVPIARDGACLGVLVFQRRGPEFTDRDLRLARVLAGAVALALHEPSPVADSRTVSLSGRARSRGLGLGRVEIIPSIESLARGRGAGIPAEQLAAALARLEKDLVRLRERVTDATGPELARALGRLDTLLSDARFRERIASARDLAALSRDYARAPFQLAASATSVDQAMLERARDVEELCVLLHLTATGGRMRDAGRVWIGDRIGAVFALAATRNAAGLVLEGEATDDAIAIARATGLPLIDQVQALFAWTRPDDLLVVDADRALVRVNPNASDLVAARRAASR